MLLQESQSALNNVVVIFLGLAEKQQLQKTHQTESWNTDSDSSSLHLCDSYQTQFSRCNIKSQSILEDTITNQQLNNESGKHNKQTIQKQNAIKNILKSFLKYFYELKDVNMIQKYQQIYNNNKKNTQANVHFTEIKKYLSKKLNLNTTRWNQKLKSIVECKKFQHIFYDYLVYQAKDWLQKSRVIDYVNHQMLINQIAKCIEDDVQLNLKVYKKKK